tara:strand:- start:193 stop:498 length:306 start_codon:yes stop_codon:yes gene_type:complete
MRKENMNPYYNLDKDYIWEYIKNYLLNENEEQDNKKEKKYLIDDSEPRDNEYGGFWYQKGYKSQKPLIHFYEKFGFKEEKCVHLDWHCYEDIPFPTMICNL